MRIANFAGLVAFCLFVSATANADVPKLINYQGRLTNTAGVPVPNSTYPVTFTIYDAATGGTNLWSETNSVTTSSGLFAVLLGNNVALPDGLFSDTTRYIGIQVSADPELIPRQRLVSSPYSYRVSTVDGASGGTITSKVSIGPGHINTGTDAFVAGESNTASGNYSTVGGGYINLADNSASTVSGGRNNKARGNYSVVSGGGGPTAADSNAALGDHSAIGGGRGNTASGFVNTISGGKSNTASSLVSTIGGGESNTASNEKATVSGGQGNIASGAGATVGGGVSNTASGPYATVPGGLANTALGALSFAAGNQAKAMHNGTFVWGDNTVADFSSTGINQFLIRASGGVGINTNSPTATLHVANSTSPAGITLGVNPNLGGYTALFTSLSAVSGGYASLQAIQSSGTSYGNLIFNASGGNIGIGTTTPAHPLHMASGAHVTAGGVWTNASSRELKTDIEPLKTEEYSDILKKLEDLDVVHFKYKAEPDVEHIGMIAEDVPEEMSSPDRKGIPTADAIAFLMAAVKAQQSQIEELKMTVKDLKDKQKDN